MYKQKGAPANLAVKAHYTVLDELIIDTFELALEKDKLTGNAQVKTGSDSWFHQLDTFGTVVMHLPVACDERTPHISSSFY
jgi:hypothetical protein